MGFKSIPLAARGYLVTVCLFGLASVMGLFFVKIPLSEMHLFEFVIFLALAACAGGRKVPIIRRAGADDAVSMSLGFVIMFAGMLRFGPAGALILGVVTCLSGCLYPKRQPMYQMTFNVSLIAVEAFVGSIVYLLLNGWTLAMRPFETFTAACVSTLIYFAVNTGGVAIIIALCSKGKAYKIWRDTFLWTAPSYFAGASVSALAMVMFRDNISMVLLLVVPIAYFTYQSYSVYSSRAEEKVRYLEEMQAQQAQLADLYLATIKSLALAIDAKDQYTHQHILRVQRYSVAIATHMGLTGGELEAVNTGALLHDIGKLGVPEYVLLKPGKLTDDEFDKIKKHPEIGAAILDPVEFPWPVLPVVKYHHERWDGKGYPEGLKGEEIPLTARIMAVADVYDALTSSRSYRSAWTHEKALMVIEKDAGTHFDPEVVKAFVEIIDGVIQEMAEAGEGPLIQRTPQTSGPETKMEQAARDISRTSTELWALYEVVQTLSSSLGLQETIGILARRLHAIFPDGTCAFLLRDEFNESLSVRAVNGLNQSFFEGAATIGQKSLSVRVAQSKETFMGEYEPDDLMLTSSESSVWQVLNSALVVPITHDDEALGTINLYHPMEQAFSDHDRQLLEMIAERAAMALYTGVLYDRSKKQTEEDPLTGSFNLTALTQHVEARCAQEAPFALLCFDLASFKPINDSFGHETGNRILRDIAELTRMTLSNAEFVARYGADEFMIVLDGSTPGQTAKLARRLQRAVQDYEPDLFHPYYGSIRLSLNVGWACYPQDGQTCATLLSAAGRMMSHHKTQWKLSALAAEKLNSYEQDSAA